MTRSPLAVTFPLGCTGIPSTGAFFGTTSKLSLRSRALGRCPLKINLALAYATLDTGQDCPLIRIGSVRPGGDASGSCRRSRRTTSWSLAGFFPPVGLLPPSHHRSLPVEIFLTAARNIASRSEPVAARRARVRIFVRWKFALRTGLIRSVDSLAS